MDFFICGWIKVSDEESPSFTLRRNHHIAATVYFLSREIIEHNNYMQNSRE